MQTQSTEGRDLTITVMYFIIRGNFIPSLPHLDHLWDELLFMLQALY